jgi:riboflavin kinase/FMN adenylyltransferase
LRIFNDVSAFSSDKRTFVTLGTFDGVHLGHRKVLGTLIQEARKSNAESVLLTFFPHPRTVLYKNQDIKLINTLDERIALLEELGLDVLVVQKFSKEFSRHSAQEFIRDILVNDLGTDRLFIGYDHRFGKNRLGSFGQLTEYGQKYGFEVSEISKKDIDDIAISSTEIRKALEHGELEKANTFLGYAYPLTGTVITGKQVGAQIGFPTANLQVDAKEKLIPCPGAYAVSAIINGAHVYGMMNIGNRPTLGGKEQSIEAHFFNYSGALYGQNLQISLHHYLREEKKFESIGALKDQLERDRKNALMLLEKTFGQTT